MELTSSEPRPTEAPCLWSDLIVQITVSSLATEFFGIKIIANIMTSCKEGVVFKKCPSVRNGICTCAYGPTKAPHRIAAFLQTKHQ